MIKLCEPKCPRFPIVRKCCFCVPIRKGVIIFGYCNMVLSLLAFPLLVFLLVEQVTTGKPIEYVGHMDPLIHLPMTIAFVVIDVSMTIVMLVGAHKKKRLLLVIYFYFGVCFQLITLFIDLAYFDYREYIENTVYFLFLGLNIYLLFLVFNVIHMIEETTEVQYVAHSNPSVAMT